MLLGLEGVIPGLEDLESGDRHVPRTLVSEVLASVSLDRADFERECRQDWVRDLASLFFGISVVANVVTVIRGLEDSSVGVGGRDERLLFVRNIIFDFGGK